MSNRWLRFGIALLAIGAAGAAGFRIFQQDQRLSSEVVAARTADQIAETAVVTISDLKAALHAYVAEGQGSEFWTARAATLINRLRTSVLELDAPATAAGTALTETHDLVDRLAAAEGRAREHVRDHQLLLAGEVIFTDARDLLDAIRLQVARARTAVADANGIAQANARRQQIMLALGAAGILAFSTLLLVLPGAGANESSVATPLATGRAGERVGDEFESTARVIARTPVAATSAPAPSPRTGSGSTTAAKPAAAGAVTKPGAAARPADETAPRVPSISLREAASVCTDFGRVSQSIEISTLLERAAKVLSASGAIVWMASPDRHEMYPAASAGYDERLLARIGSIKRDANNVTAAALRDASPRTSASVGVSAAALAVPLLTPLGPVGVFSAEIRDVTTVDETRLAIATIFAAQLATLLGSMATVGAGEPSATDSTQPAKAQA